MTREEALEEIKGLFENSPRYIAHYKEVAEVVSQIDDIERNNCTLVPTDKLKEMQEELKRLRSEASVS